MYKHVINMVRTSVCAEWGLCLEYVACDQGGLGHHVVLGDPLAAQHLVDGETLLLLGLQTAGDEVLGRVGQISRM